MDNQLHFIGQLQATGFAFQKGDTDREMQALAIFANAHQVPRRFFPAVADIPPGWIACGNSAWVTEALGGAITPDYYPLWLHPWLHRYVWLTSEWPLAGVFVKPADSYKRFTGLVVPPSCGAPEKGPFWCSEAVAFSNEWRFYVAEGRVLAAFWYAGVDEDKPAPAISVPWPSGYCGAVDFGELADGRVALVEAQHPFACGWYGRLSEGSIYAQWITAGWNYMKTQRPG